MFHYRDGIQERHDEGDISMQFAGFISMSLPFIGPGSRCLLRETPESIDATEPQIAGFQLTARKLRG